MNRQFVMNLFVCLQLFRRVAAALPGMEQTEPKKGESILCFIFEMISFSTENRFLVFGQTGPSCSKLC